MAKGAKQLTAEIATHEALGLFRSISNILPDPDLIISRAGKSAEYYTEIAENHAVFASMEQRKAQTLAMEWELLQEDAPDELLQLIESWLKRFDVYGFINTVLNAPFYGISVQELTWKYAGAWLPVKALEKPYWWFKFTKEGEPRFITPKAPEGVILPESKFIITQYRATYINPYGERILKRCFWPAMFLKGGLKFWVKFTEKYGDPFLYGKLPPGTDLETTQKLLDSLADMVQDAVAVIPDNSSIGFIESNKAGSVETYERFASYMEYIIRLAILTQNLTSSVDGGSYAASQTHADMLRNLAEGDSRLVEKAFNTLIYYIAKENYGIDETTPLPRFRMYTAEDVDKTLADRDKVLTEQGISFTREYYRKSYNLQDEDFILQSEKAKDQSAQFADIVTGTDVIPVLKLPEVLLNKQGDQLIKPLINMVRNYSDYDKLREAFAAMVPDLSSDEITETLTKVIFLAEAAGRISENAE